MVNSVHRLPELHFPGRQKPSSVQRKASGATFALKASRSPDGDFASSGDHASTTDFGFRMSVCIFATNALYSTDHLIWRRYWEDGEDSNGSV